MALVSRDNYNASGVHRHLTAISSRLLHQPRGTHDSMLNTVTEVMQQNWRTSHKYVGFLCAEHQRDGDILRSMLKDAGMPHPKPGRTKEGALAEWRDKRDA